MVTGYAVLKNEELKRKIDFYVYQGESGAIYMNLGNFSFALTKEQAEKVDYTINFYEMVENFNLESYKNYYKNENKEEKILKSKKKSKKKLNNF